MSDAPFDSHARRALRSLYAGDSSFSLARLAFAGAGGAAPLTIDDLRFTSLVSSRRRLPHPVHENEHRCDCDRRPSRSPALILMSRFGIWKWNPWSNWCRRVREVNQDRTLAPAARTEKMLSLLKQQGARLLAQQPQIAFDQISFANAERRSRPQGPSAAAGRHLPPISPTVRHPKALIQKLDADLDLTVDEALLKSLPGGAERRNAIAALGGPGIARPRKTASSTRESSFVTGS